MRLRAYGADLNPVAALIGKSLIEIPPRFAGLPPINREAREELHRGGRWNTKGAQGLADDVRHYGQWLRQEAAKRIEHFYPKAKLQDGSEATVVAWIWARTVRSPDPAARGAMVPLVSSYLLCTKDARKAWVDLVLDANAPDGWRFDVQSGDLDKVRQDKLKLGTKAGKGQAFVCVLTGTAIDRAYIQAEGKADRLGIRLMAIVAEGARKRLYVSPSPEHIASAKYADSWPTVESARLTFLQPPIPTRAMITGGVCSAYGLRTYGHLFTDRELVALTTLCDLVDEVRERVLADAMASGLNEDGARLHAGGNGAAADADAVVTYLGFVINKVAQTLNTMVRWFPQGEKASRRSSAKHCLCHGTSRKPTFLEVRPAASRIVLNM